MPVIRVLIVDDQAVLRAGLRALLETERDILVVGQAASADEAVERTRELRPAVVLMGLLVAGGGLDATRRITAVQPGARVLLMTVQAGSESLLPVLQAGGRGYVGRRSGDRDLVRALRVVAAGDVFLYPGAARVLTHRLVAPGGEPLRDPLALLSGREREVLLLTAQGFSSTEIGEKLGLSHKTVETYRQRLMDKLELRHRSQLVRFALRQGLLVASA